MSHTLTIAGLDEFEADHVAQVLLDYKSNMLLNKLEDMAEDSQDGSNRAEWYDEHIAWHESIMKKAVWTKE